MPPERNTLANGGDRRRLAGALLFSIAAHILIVGALVTWLARPPIYPVAADETAWVVQLVPPPQRLPPAPRSAPRPVKRILSKPWTQSDTAEPVPSEVLAGGEKVGTPAGSEAADGEATPERVRQALRSGPVGCANADAVGLNRQERAHCNDVFGKNMVQIRRAMREAEQSRLSTGGKPPTDYERFRAAEARAKAAATGDPACAPGAC